MVRQILTTLRNGTVSGGVTLNKEWDYVGPGKIDQMRGTAPVLNVLSSKTQSNCRFF